MIKKDKPQSDLDDDSSMASGKNYSNQSFFNYKSFDVNKIKPKVQKKTNPILDELPKEQFKKTKKLGDKWLKKEKDKPNKIILDKNQINEDVASSSESISPSFGDLDNLSNDNSPIVNKKNQNQAKKNLTPIPEEKTSNKERTNKSPQVMNFGGILANPPVKNGESSKSFLDRILNENKGLTGSDSKKSRKFEQDVANLININDINKKSKSNSSKESLEFNYAPGSKNKICDFDNNLQVPNNTAKYVISQKETGLYINKNNENINNKNAKSYQNKKPTIKTGERDALISNINEQMNSLSSGMGNVNNSSSNDKDNKDYSFELNNIEDRPYYAEFYNLKTRQAQDNKRTSLGNKNFRPKNKISILDGLNENINNKSKKQREKMNGHPCELCKKFIECLGENTSTICQECSRHRSNRRINHKIVYIEEVII